MAREKGGRTEGRVRRVLTLSPNRNRSLSFLQESLAYSFEGMNLFEDAMIQYDELEASFFQVLKGSSFLSSLLLSLRIRSPSSPLHTLLSHLFLYPSIERNLSWFGKFGGTSPSDDSSSILSVSAKPYRDLILANSISVFDFRIYVFARQCRMLGRMGRGEEVLKKGAEFVRSFGRVLSENKVSRFKLFCDWPGEQLQKGRTR